MELNHCSPVVHQSIAGVRREFNKPMDECRGHLLSIFETAGGRGGAHRDQMFCGSYNTNSPPSSCMQQNDASSRRPLRSRKTNKFVGEQWPADEREPATTISQSKSAILPGEQPANVADRGISLREAFSKSWPCSRLSSLTTPSQHSAPHSDASVPESNRAGHTNAELPTTLPADDSIEGNDLDRVFENSSNARNDKRARAFSSEDWVVPQPPSLKRQSSWSHVSLRETSFQCLQHAYEFDSSNENSHSKKVIYSKANLVANLYSPPGLGHRSSQDMIRAWKGLRCLLCTELSRSLSLFFRGAFHDQRYLQDTELAEQLILTILAISTFPKAESTTMTKRKLIASDKLLTALIHLAQLHPRNDDDTRLWNQQTSTLQFIVKAFSEIVQKHDLPIPLLIKASIDFLSMLATPKESRAPVQEIKDDHIQAVFGLSLYRAYLMAVALLIDHILVDQALPFTKRLVSGAVDNNDSQVVAENLKQLSTLIPLVSKQALRSCSASIVNTLACLAKRYDDARPIQNATLEAFRYLVQNGEIASLVNSEETLSYLMYDCVRNGAILACVEASSIIYDMIKHDAVALGEKIMRMQHGSKILIECMERHSEKYPVQDCLCAALEAVTLTASESLKNRALGSRVDGGKVYLTIVMDVLDRFPASETIVRSACRALIGLLPYIHRDLLWQQRRSLCGCVAQALKAVQGGRNVMAEEAAIDLWFHLCKNSDTYRGELARSFPVLLDSMRHNIRNVILNSTVCRIINLTARFQGDTLVKQNKDCVETLMNSFLFHSQSPSYVRKMLSTLTTIAAIPNSCDIMTMEEEILCVAKIHASRPGILVKALNVFNNTAVANHLRTLSDRLFQFVMSSMMKYAFEEDVQMSACRLLWNLLIGSKTVKSKLRLQASSLSPLLISAAHHFPQTCGRRAQLILSFIIS
ncbi:hypothetical protein ACA910_000867 [Epithemia clementina (nom. ined.)]